MLIGIDASRAAKPQKTGTEWYSYFVIEELKKIIQAAPPLPSPPHQGEGKEKTGVESNRFILYSREPLEGELGKLQANFESRVLRWPPKRFWTQIRLSWEMMVRPPYLLFVPAHTLPVFGRAKTVVTIHDVGFRAYPHLYSFVDKLYHRFSVWYASRYAHKIICISEFTKSELIRYYGTDPKKIVVVPMGVEEPNSFEEAMTSPLLMRRGLEGGPSLGDKNPFLLFIGRLEQKKNILGILQAFEILRKQFPNLKLVLAGRPGFGFGEFQKYINEHQLASAVEILGYVTDEQRERLYRDAKVFLFPTFYEGFGLPILEAQIRGCPVVTSNCGAQKEVGQGSAVLVEPGSAQDIAKAVDKLLSDPKYRDEIISAGYANAAKYSWKATAEKTLEALVN